MSTRTAMLAALAALTLFGAACGSDDDSGGPGEIPDDRDELGTDPAPVATDPVATDPPADDLRPGLQVTSVDFTTGVAVITNNGERDIDITGYWICQRPNYAELPARVLAPGEFVEASLGGFAADGGEVAVYSSDAFGDPTAIQAYVGWGSGGGRETVAEDAGIWSGDPVQPAGDSIELTGDPGSAAGWS